MKKIFSLILAAVITAATLASCAGTQAPENTGPVETTASGKLPGYAGQTVNDYDSEGNFILRSSEDRVVYTYGTGFAVFTFAGESVKKIQQVLTFESEEAAQQYVNDTALAAIDKGEVPPTMRANKNYVIVQVGSSSDKKDLGFYYTQSRAKVTAAFESTDAEAEH